MPVKSASDIIGTEEPIVSFFFENREIQIPMFRAQMRIQELEDEVEILREHLNLLKKEFEKSEGKNIVFVQEVPFVKAKQMVLQFIQKHKEGIYTVDIAKELNLDIGVVLKALDELKKEDKIAKSD